jgi:nicotinamide phosphoribosyltransferase
MFGEEAAVLSGLGHLLSFSGTDTLPAILEAQKYYHADLSIGGSVPATEHSVMCAGSKDSEQETFRRLIEDVYPKGVVSIVSDTWDLWKVLTEIVPNLRNKILARDGKVVIRPDSGDPVKILTGDDSAPPGTHEHMGALVLLHHALGGKSSDRKGRAMINKGGLIYGDSITVDRADQILTRTREQGFSPYNHVFGIGSYTYQYVTRDTYNFAFKATAIEDGDGIKAIFKEPVTAGDFSKKSARGIPVVNIDFYLDILRVLETTDPRMLDVEHNEACAFRKVFDGALLVDEDFETIRKRVRTRDWEEA